MDFYFEIVILKGKNPKQNFYSESSRARLPLQTDLSAQ